MGGSSSGSCSPGWERWRSRCWPQCSSWRFSRLFCRETRIDHYEHESFSFLASNLNKYNWNAFQMCMASYKLLCGSYHQPLRPSPEPRRGEPGMPVFWCTAAWLLREMFQRVFFRRWLLDLADGDDWSLLTRPLDFIRTKEEPRKTDRRNRLPGFLQSVCASGWSEGRSLVTL